MNFLGRDERKSIPQVKPHLMPEDTDGSRPCSVWTLYPLIQNPLEQVEILLHLDHLTFSLRQTLNVRHLATKYKEKAAQNVQLFRCVIDRSRLTRESSGRL